MGAPRLLTEDQEQEVVRRYEEGEPLRDIFEDFDKHCSRATVQRTIRRYTEPRSSAGPDRKLCSCGEKVYRSGECSVCYRARLAIEAEQCNVEFCEQGVIGKGVCNKHLQRLNNGQDLEVSTWVNTYGYICEYIPHHPQANSDGRTVQHRRVMSDHLGRKLESYENVHHINGDKTDNQIENLELWVNLQPSGQRVEDLVQYAKQILERYGDAQ